MDSNQLSGVTVILREAILLPAKNRKLALSAVLLCTLPSSLLLMGDHISVYPLLLTLLIKLHLIAMEDPNTPQFFDAVVGLKNEAEAFVGVRALIAMATHAISTVSMMMVVHLSLLLCSGKQASLKDVYLRIKSNWLPVFVTCVYFSLLCTGYTVLSVSLIAVPMLSAGGSKVFVMAGGLTAVMARLLSAYLAMEWMVGVVAAVAEDGCSGLEAMWRGAEMVKGRRVQGFAVALVLSLAEGVFSGGLAFARKRNCIGFILVNVLVVTKMFSHVVYAVFYCQCRKEVCHTRVIPAAGEMGV